MPGARPIPEADLPAWLGEIAQHFQQEIKIHFAAEETVLFPAARQFQELISLVEELVADHASLRESFSRAESRQLSAEEVAALAEQLAAHIRKEERQLFETMQRLMGAEELADLGLNLETALKDAAQSCVFPNQVTKLKPKC